MTVVGMVLGAFVTYLISSAYQTPLVEMKHATEEVQNGNYEVKVAVVSTDELGRLGEGINDMAVGLKERERLKEENERVRQELAMAWHIQESFLPKELPYVPGWQLAAKLEPAKQTSGDFYDLIPLPDGRLGLLVADVTDKGMGAALYMALSRTIIRTFAGEFHAEPQKVLNAAHRRILADSDTDQFVTVFYGILDPTTGVLTYSNAGHNPPFLLGGRSGSAPAIDSEQLIAVHELMNTGPPLGLRMFKDIAWEQGSVQVGDGDVLVLYSDGVTEAQDLREEFFEEERLLNVLRANVGRSAQLIQDALIGEVHSFVGQAPQSDDITVMVIVRE
jgi:sigma-B regulation protein RsbU (phosphoserine phosphatase)